MDKDAQTPNATPSSSTSGTPSNKSSFKPSGVKTPRVKYALMGIVAFLLCAFLYIYNDSDLSEKVFGSMFQEKEDFSAFVTKKVEKEAFKVTVEAKGAIDSSRNSSLVNNVEGSTTIISIVPPGTMVIEPLRAQADGVIKEIQNLSSRTPTIILLDKDGKEIEHPYEMSVYSEVLVKVGDTVSYNDILIGDLVCELDSSSLVDAEKQQQISVTQAEADLEKGIKNVEIQEAQNESDIAAAELAMKLADLDLKKYQEGDYIQEKERIEGEIEQAREDLKLAEASLEFTRRVARKGYKNADDVEVERIKVLKARLQLNVKVKELEVLDNFTKERQIAELLEMAKESKRELKRVTLAGQAALAQYQAEVSSRKLSYSVQKSQLDRLQAQIKACRLIAPQAGQVVYANENSRRGSEQVIIEEGTSVRERQKIINLPDMSAMKVDARIHESKISNVVAKLNVIIRVDAIPGHVYSGILDTVSSVPVPGGWMNPDLKEYEAIVRILDEGKWLNELKPGMTANIEIIVEESYDKLLQIPVQAAVDIGRGYYAWVMTEKGPERRKLELGRSNDVKFVVLGGVEEGEEVIMNPRSHFSEEIAKLEAESLQKAQQDRKESGGISRSDPSAGSSAGPQGPGQGPGGPGGGATAQQGPGGGRGQFNPADIFARRDADGDGELSGDEISDRMKENLPTMDTDGNGKISKEEFMAGMQRAGGGGGAGPGGRPPGGGPPNRGGETRGAE